MLPHRNLGQIIVLVDRDLWYLFLQKIFKKQSIYSTSFVFLQKTQLFCHSPLLGILIDQ